jgi:hypothetical protein
MLLATDWRNLRRRLLRARGGPDYRKGMESRQELSHRGKTDGRLENKRQGLSSWRVWRHWATPFLCDRDSAANRGSFDCAASEKAAPEAGAKELLTTTRHSI